MTRPLSYRRALAATGALAMAGTLALSAPPALAGGHHGRYGHHHHPPAPATPVVVATGLDNPRQLSISDGALYVAEAGTGGTGSCSTGPEGDTVCLGDTGAVTRVDRWGQRRVLDGLPSVAAQDGTSAIGPSDVAVRDGRYAVLLGLGASPDARAALGEDGAQLGTLLGGSFRSYGHGYDRRAHRYDSGPRVLADVSAYEGTANPDQAQIDTNPVGLWAGPRGFVVADAGGNDVLGVGWRGDISTLGTFPVRPGVPTGLPAPNPPVVAMDAVPTSAVPGPDGALYVTQLTGFPFPVGGANIYRLVPGQAPTVYASGFTNLTDLAWYHGSLYAVQLADQGLLAAGDAPPSGSLVKVTPSGTTTVADDLVAPYGLAIDDGSAYVSTCSVCPGGGEVVKVALPRY